VDRRGAAYQGAFEAVFAILIAIGLGYWADQSFGSAPIGMFTGVVLGFAAFVVRLIRLRSLIEGPGEPGDEDGPQSGPEADGPSGPKRDGIEGP
jgi:F0F1-type ATP synthase assembly protein I